MWGSNLKLNNPPIVEAWIEFHMEAAQDQHVWPSQLESFLPKLGEEFPKSEREFLATEVVEVGKRDPSGVPLEISGETRLERVKAFDASRTRCVQVGENLLVFNLTRKGAEYPGFPLLLKEGLRHLAAYDECMHPQYVREAALHYVDVIEIPFESSGIVRAHEYLNLRVTTPEGENWPIMKSATQVSIDISGRTEHPDHLVVGLQTDSDAAHPDRLKVRINWHAVCREVGTLDPNILAERLRGVRAVIRQFFQKAVTDKLWETFEPMNGG